MRRGLAVLLLSTLMPGRAGADQPPQPKCAVRVELEVISVSLTEARQLIPRLRDAETFLETRVRLKKLLESGEAELLDFAVHNQLVFEGIVDILSYPPGYQGKPVLHADSSPGQAYSVEEVEVPTEMDPPNPPQTIEYQIPWEPTIESTMSTPAVFVPVNFYTRFAGTMLGVDANRNKDGSIDLAIAVRYSKLLGIEAPIGARSERIGDRKLSHPRFRDFRFGSVLRFKDRESRLIGVCSQEVPKSGFILFLLSSSAEQIPTLAP